MIIDTQEIESLLETITVDDMLSIEVENTVLEQLQADKQQLYQCNLKTLVKLQNAVNRNKQKTKEKEVYVKQKKVENTDINYVGIDVGQKRIITASDYTMNDYIILQSGAITKRIKKYKSFSIQAEALKSRKTMEEYRESFKKHIKNIIKSNFRAQLEQKYNQPTVYVIGKHFLMFGQNDVQFVLTECIFEALQEESEDSESIVGVQYVNERYTSVKCPECNKGNPLNKTQDGFFCINCGFHHEKADVVACHNILKKYKRIKTKEGKA